MATHATHTGLLAGPAAAFLAKAAVHTERTALARQLTLLDAQLTQCASDLASLEAKRWRSLVRRNDSKRDALELAHAALLEARAKLVARQAALNEPMPHYTRYAAVPFAPQTPSVPKTPAFHRSQSASATVPVRPARPQEPLFESRAAPAPSASRPSHRRTESASSAARPDAPLFVEYAERPTAPRRTRSAAPAVAMPTREQPPRSSTPKPIHRVEFASTTPVSTPPQAVSSLKASQHRRTGSDTSASPMPFLDEETPRVTTAIRVEAPRRTHSASPVPGMRRPTHKRTHSNEPRAVPASPPNVKVVELAPLPSPGDPWTPASPLSLEGSTIGPPNSASSTCAEPAPKPVRPSTSWWTPNWLQTAAREVPKLLIPEVKPTMEPSPLDFACAGGGITPASAVQRAPPTLFLQLPGTPALDMPSPMDFSCSGPPTPAQTQGNFLNVPGMHVQSEPSPLDFSCSGPPSPLDFSCSGPSSAVSHDHDHHFLGAPSPMDFSCSGPSTPAPGLTVPSNGYLAPHPSPMDFACSGPSTPVEPTIQLTVSSPPSAPRSSSPPAQARTASPALCIAIPEWRVPNVAIAHSPLTANPMSPEAARLMSPEKTGADALLQGAKSPAAVALSPVHVIASPTPAPAFQPVELTILGPSPPATESPVSRAVKALSQMVTAGMLARPDFGSPMRWEFVTLAPNERNLNVYIPHTPGGVYIAHTPGGMYHPSPEEEAAYGFDGYLGKNGVFTPFTPSTAGMEVPLLPAMPHSGDSCYATESPYKSSAGIYDMHGDRFETPSPPSSSSSESSCFEEGSGYSSSSRTSAESAC